MRVTQCFCAYLLHTCPSVWRSEVSVRCLTQSLCTFLASASFRRFQVFSGLRPHQSKLCLGSHMSYCAPGKFISSYLYEDSCHQIQSLLGESRLMSSLTLSCLQVLEYLTRKVTFSGFEIIFHEDSYFTNSHGHLLISLPSLPAVPPSST